MLSTKKKRRKDNQRGSFVTIFVFFMVLVLLGISWVFIQNLDNDDQLTDRPDSEVPSGTPPMMAGSVEQLQEMIPEINTSLNEDKLNDLFPASFRVLVNRMDINANGNNEIVLIEYHPADAERSLSFTDTGYERIISRAEVLTEDEEGRLHLLLRITQDKMTDHEGEVLIAQEPARYGYAFRTVLYEGEEYNAPVRLFELAILDENFQPASDDLVIYWMPSENRYAATNAFGQPGSF
ncbi:MAG: hypothetical protein LAT84_05100 [Balneolia bacterium]|nr:hypothetical protein [Balneolia bacterium]